LSLDDDLFLLMLLLLLFEARVLVPRLPESRIDNFYLVCAETWPTVKGAVEL